MLCGTLAFGKEIGERICKARQTYMQQHHTIVFSVLVVITYSFAITCCENIIIVDYINASIENRLITVVITCFSTATLMSDLEATLGRCSIPDGNNAIQNRFKTPRKSTRHLGFTGNEHLFPNKLTKLSTTESAGPSQFSELKQKAEIAFSHKTEKSVESRAALSVLLNNNNK